MSVDPSIQEQVFELLSDPMNLPPVFWSYATQNWLKDAPIFPITQAFGFMQFAAAAASPILTSETTTSASYTDLATAGPSLTGLADGKYVVWFGTYAKSSLSGAPAIMSVQPNSTAASDNDAAVTGGTDQTAISRATIFSLSNNGSNSLTAKYRADGTHTGTFGNRWIVALKYANN